MPLALPRFYTPNVERDTLAILLWGIVAVILALLLFKLLTVLQQRLERRLGRVRLFQDLIHDRDLSSEDERWIRTLTELEGSDDPYVIASSLDDFDRLSQRYLAGFGEEDHAERLQAGNALLDIRERLFFADPSPRTSVIDSRVLTTNMAVRLSAPSGTELLRATVIAVDTDIFTLTVSGDETLPEPGAPIEVYTYLRGKGGYRFTTQVVSSVQQPDRTMTLAHTLEFERIQLREFVRVPTDIAVRFHHIALPGAERPDHGYGATSDKAEFLGTHRGTLRNLSLGGMSIRSQEAVPEGAYVGVSIAAQESGDEKLDLLGQVVGHSEVGTHRQKLHNIHVQFADMDDATRDRLLRTLFRLRSTARGRPME